MRLNRGGDLAWAGRAVVTLALLLYSAVVKHACTYV